MFLFLLLGAIPRAGVLAKPGVVPKWDLYECSFRSSLVYPNPVQEVSLRVVFTSPVGETREVDGFWDGGKTWRARFAPDQPGRWKFKTACSDAANRGLNNQHGDFLCTSAIGITRFKAHGRVRVAMDHRHLEHVDGTPFFWLADTVWDGARNAELKDWEFYAGVRAAQRFSVAQWAVAPGEDRTDQSAYSGFPERISINPDFFKRLDARLEVLAQAGILSAIAPMLELQWDKGAGVALPDDQAELLLRYVVARWGAEPVAWLVAFEGDGAGKYVSRWKRIGRAVFGSRAHAPVVLFPGQTTWLFDEFREEKWIDVFGDQGVTGLTDDALKWTFAGSFAEEWKKEPARPLIPFAPYENGMAGQTGKRFGSEDVRHAVYWSLLLTPPAGVSYGGQGVVNWDSSAGPRDAQTGAADLPMWRKALFMPAAKEMAPLARFMDSIDFWRLRPDQKVVATQPGQQSPGHFITAAGTEDRALSVVYVPEDRTVDLLVDGLPRSPAANWYNPRTGESSPAVAVVSGRSCQFLTPNAGDWVLVVKGGK